MAPPRKKGGKGVPASVSKHACNVGDLVVAKVKGHPWWPARVSQAEEFGQVTDRRKVFVYFFGTQQIGFVQPRDVRAFTQDTRKNLLIKSKVKSTVTDFSRAVKEICEADNALVGCHDANSQVSLNEEEDLTNEEAPELEEVDHVAASGTPVSHEHKRGNRLRSSSQDGVIAPRRSGNSDGCEARRTRGMTRGSQIRAIYEPARKKRRKLIGSGEDSKWRDSIAASVKSASLSRRPSLRNYRNAEGTYPNSLLNHADDARDEHSEEEDVTSPDHSKVGDLMSAENRLPASLIGGETRMESMFLEENRSYGKHQGSSASWDNASPKDFEDASCDSPRSATALEKPVPEIQDAKEESIDLPPQSVLPRKKRRAFRKPEREMNSWSKQDEQIHLASSPQHSPAEEQLQLPRLPEAPTKPVSVEYQRRKRASIITHNIGQVDSQEVGNNSEQDNAPTSNDSRKELSPIKPVQEEHRLSKDLDELLSREAKPFDADDPLTKGNKDPIGTDVFGGEKMAGRVVDKSLKVLEEYVMNDEDSSKVSMYVAVKSAVVGDTEACLPPKADKYRIRGSIADGEAALPPTKRRRRALEAMTACAAEAEAGRELEQPSNNLEQPPPPDTTPGQPSNHQFGKFSTSEMYTSQLPVQPQLSPSSSSGNLQKAELVVQLVHQNDESPIPSPSQEGLEKTSESDKILMGNESKASLSTSGSSLKKDRDMRDSSPRKVESGNFLDLDMRASSPKKVETGKLKQVKPENQAKASDAPNFSTEKGDNKLKLKSKQADGSLEKVGNEGILIHQEESSKQVVLTQTKGGAPRMPSDTMSLIKELMKSDRRLETSFGPSKPQVESNTNKVRAALEAAQKAKEAQLKRHAALNKFSGDRSSPGGSLNHTPSHVAGATLDSGERSHTPSGTLEHSEEHRISPSYPLSKLGGDAEASAARGTFEGMLVTLSRTKDSIARATRHALECAKLGIADQVVEIIVQRLENEPSFHRRIDLFFLVDSITQLSGSIHGIAGASYPPAIQAALPRLVRAAAPAGNLARENRRQCLKVLKLWISRRVMPESVLRCHINGLEAHNDDKAAGVSLRRPARYERAIDDPIREMEGMYVDEYGSNATFGLTNLLSSRMFEDDEDTSAAGKNPEGILQSSSAHEEAKEPTGACPLPAKKHRHILEDVEGELEMEDASPEAAIRNYAFAERYLPAELDPPPPPPPNVPPPSPPPLPASPPPPSSPSPPQLQPAASPSLPPAASLTPPSTYTSPFLHSYGSSSFASVPSSQLSPIVMHPGLAAAGYAHCREPPPVLSLAGAHPLPSTSNEEGMYGHTHHPQQPYPSQSIVSALSPVGAPMLNREPTYGASMLTKEPTYGAPILNKEPTYGAPMSNKEPTYGASMLNKEPAYGASMLNKEPAYCAPLPAPMPNKEPAYGVPMPNIEPAYPAPMPNQEPVYGTPMLYKEPPYGTPMLNKEPAYGTPMLNSEPAYGAHSSQSFNSSIPHSHNGAQVLPPQQEVVIPYTQAKYSRLPSPPPLPPGPPRYGNLRPPQQSSSPSVERPRGFSHTNPGQFEYRHTDNGHGRGRYDDGPMPSQVRSEGYYRHMTSDHGRARYDEGHTLSQVTGEFVRRQDHGRGRYDEGFMPSQATRDYVHRQDHGRARYDEGHTSSPGTGDFAHSHDHGRGRYDEGYMSAQGTGELAHRPDQGRGRYDEGYMSAQGMGEFAHRSQGSGEVRHMSNDRSQTRFDEGHGSSQIMGHSNFRSESSQSWKYSSFDSRSRTRYGCNPPPPAQAPPEAALGVPAGPRAGGAEMVNAPYAGHLGGAGHSGGTLGGMMLSDHQALGMGQRSSSSRWRPR